MSTLHYPTCVSWQSGEASDCDCFGQKPWQIKKIDDGDDHPWVISRRTSDGEEPFLYCRTQQNALKLVDGLIWLGREGLRPGADTGSRP